MNADATIGFVVSQRSSRRRKALGQNFLHDAACADRIVRELAPKPGDQVLEIGPGKGILTDRVAGRVERLVAVEIDEALADELDERFADAEGVRIVQGDVLRVDLDELGFEPDRPVRVLSNLPYSIATAVIERLLGWSPVEDLLLMVQKEVADRMLAPPSTSERGRLSVLIELACSEAEAVFTVGPGVFRPPPKVDSTVIHLHRRGEGEAPSEAEGVLHLAGEGFAHRRKTLYNNLRSSRRLSAPLWGEICRTTRIEPRARAEELDLASWIALHRALQGPARIDAQREEP